jgi:hypothetical protein
MYELCTESRQETADNGGVFRHVCGLPYGHPGSHVCDVCGEQWLWNGQNSEQGHEATTP